MLCVCREMRWWASKDRGQNQQCSLCLPVRLRKQLSWTQTVWLQRLFKGAKRSQRGRLLALHPAPPQTRQSHSRTGNKEFSEGAVMIHHKKTVLSPGTAQLSLQLKLPFRSAFMPLVSPEDMCTLLCRCWKLQSSCRIVMVKLCWWVALINGDVKIWIEFRKMAHRFHRLKEAESPWRKYVPRLWEHN